METQLHFLRTYQNVYLEMELGAKLFDIRKNDRDFRVGDYLYLKETREIDDKYTGNEMIFSVSYILAACSYASYGLQEGYCAMSLVKLLPQVQTSIKKLAYKWDDKLSILFNRNEGIKVIEEFAKSSEWIDYLQNGNENTSLTVDQLKINLIRRAETWYDVEYIKEKGMNIFEQKLEFEKWLGW